MIPLALRLVEFSPEGQAHEPAAIPAEPINIEVSALELAEAYERGRLAGRQEEQEVFADKFEQDRQRLDQRLQALRDEWNASQVEPMAQQLTAAMAAIEERLADHVAKILEPFVEKALQVKAVEEFCATIKDAVRGSAEALIAITGPRDLLDAIAAKLKPLPVPIEYVVSDACVVSARLGATIFETQLSRWLSALEGEQQ